jgi:selenocysteine lyase/cysteine desulfurase
LKSDLVIGVDGVAFAPHRAIDVQELGVDFYVFSLYKVFGPHISLLYAKEELIKKLGNINHFFLEHGKCSMFLKFVVCL